METVSDTRIFVDTNILYYLNNQTESFGKQAFARIKEFVDLQKYLLFFSLVSELCCIQPLHFKYGAATNELLTNYRSLVASDLDDVGG